MNVVQYAEFNPVRVGIDKDKTRSVAAIIEVNGTRFYSQPPRDTTERDIINSNLNQYIEGQQQLGGS